VPSILYIRQNGAGSDRLADLLDSREFEVRSVEQPALAMGLISPDFPDLVLMACLRPDDATLAFCAGLREASDVPIVLCSPVASEADIVRAFHAGVDDYLVTPLRPVELSARLRAVLRRAGDFPERRQRGDVLIAGDVEVRLKEHKAFRRGLLLELSPIEFRLLAVLVEQAGRAVSHAKLIARVWGPEYVDCRHYLRLYIKYLRAKVEDDPKDPKLILNEWGVGYRFEPAQA
jgi:two-component system KDP operon response regulator KdpE